MPPHLPHPPPGVALLVPVKSLTHAKTRLAPLLTREERQLLVRTMLETVLGELATAWPDTPRWVVASEPWALGLAESLGFGTLRESTQDSESHSVDAASSQLAAGGVTGVLRLPLDLPLFRAQALAPLWDAVARGVNVVLIPSRDGTGTNALFRSPPDRFPSRFGPGSLRLHLEEARKSGCEPAILPVPELGLDIDDPEDVAELMRRDQPCKVLNLLRGMKVEARLAGPLGGKFLEEG